jgi:acyl-CoA thioesterase-1
MLTWGRFRAIAGAVACAAVALACGSEPRAPAAPDDLSQSPRIVAFGDSLTAGFGIRQSEAYPAILQARLDSLALGFAVVNAGVSGDTSKDGRDRLRRVLALRPRIMILAFGANDGLEGLPVDDMKRNLDAIITQAKSGGIDVVLCGMEALPRNGLRYSLEFHQVFPELARQHNLSLVPFLLAGVIGNPSLTQSDLVHPNAAGARVLADNIWPYLLPLARAAAAPHAPATSAANLGS